MLQPTGTPDSPLPIQFSVPEEEFNTALAEMQSFSTDHLRECDEKALRFLTKADNEATAVAGQHDLIAYQTHPTPVSYTHLTLPTKA